MTSHRFETIERKAVVRAMADVLAASTATLSDEPECWELLLLSSSETCATAFSRAEIEDCLVEAIDQAVKIREHMEAASVAA